MPTVTKLAGFVLLMIAVGSWLSTGADEITALIPALFGLPLLAAGALADKREDLRQHAIHGALVVALLGLLALAPTALGIGAMGDASDTARIESLLAATVCLVYLVAGVKLFIAARKARKG